MITAAPSSATQDWRRGLKLGCSWPSGPPWIWITTGSLPDLAAFGL